MVKMVGYTSIRCQDHSMLEYTEEALSLHRQSSSMEFDGVPRLAMNRSTPMKQELQSIDGTTSIWMALVVKQVNKNAQRFSELLRIVT